MNQEDTETSYCDQELEMEVRSTFDGDVAQIILKRSQMMRPERLVWYW